MDKLKVDIIGILYQLLPGFISTWIFYTLTSYIKPDNFERIIQSLIYTVLSKTAVIITKMALFYIGAKHSFGHWTDEVEIIYMVAYSIFLGLIATWCVNNDFPLSFIRANAHLRWGTKTAKYLGWITKSNLTNMTLHPNEWFSFLKGSNYICLHLSDNRILGQIIEYPDDPKSGHFILANACWLSENNTQTEVGSGNRIMISASDVKFIESVA